MATISNAALDSALEVIDNATTLHICSTEPASFAAVSGVSLGDAAVTFTGPVDGDVSGRKVTVSAITTQPVTGTGTATYWALVDGTTLYATGALDSPQGVVSGNTFSLAAFDIEIRDPA